MQNLKNSILKTRNFNELNTLNQVCDQGNAEALSLLGIVWTEIIGLGFLSSKDLISKKDSESFLEIKSLLKKQLEISLLILFGNLKRNSNLNLLKISLVSSLQILEKLENPGKLQSIFQEILIHPNWKFLDHAVQTLTTTLKVRFYKFLKETLNQLILKESLEIQGIRKKRKLLENLSTDYKKILENSFYMLQREKETLNLLFQEKFGKKVYSDAWLAFLSHSMDNKTLKKVLIELDSVIPNLEDPRLLADFYVDSYNQSGILGILALNGIFTLITKYDLEYLKFYEKLYQLLEPSVLHSKFKSRFFNLVSIFLNSSLLPVNLVAGFIKKFARLALFAPPTGITLILPIIYNLLRSHHKCIVMIHKPKEESLSSLKGKFKKN